MDPSHYFSRLYPLQDIVLSRLTALDTGLYLTGGTAASRGYLHHRFSDDLDLFANDAGDFVLWADRVVHALAGDATWSCRVLLREARFVRAAIQQGDLTLKIEMVNDVPSRVGPVTLHPTLGRLDSAENILANKITALLDRAEPKDMADIWAFGQLMGLSVRAAITGAQGKAAGVFAADVARALYGATTDDWAAIRWTDPPPPELFVADLRTLAEDLLLNP
jgi:hypothetical protein